MKKKVFLFLQDGVGGAERMTVLIGKSFALEDNEQFYVPGMPRSIGDIFISVDHAKVQAEEYGHDLKREMCFLFTHGLLHLLGFDHMIEEDEIQMIAMQKSILDALNITRR